MSKINDIIFITKRNFFVDIFIDQYIWNIDNIKEQENPNLSSEHATEDFYNSICKRINECDLSIKGILIDFELGGYDAFSIAHHIRLDSDSDLLHNIPIIITHDEDITFLKGKYLGVNDLGLLENKGARFEIYQKLFKTDESTEKLRIFDLIDKFKSDFNYDDYLKGVEIFPDKKETTRHQIANEWGAFKLAHEAGFDISYNLPQTLYFKYLKAKYSDIQGNNTEKIFQDELKVLFIDDNYDKGWYEALEKILPAKVFFKDDKMKILTDSQLNVNVNEFDLIFLDIYLPTIKGENPKYSTRHARDILRKIKKENPAVPVIIFTASNKVWNLQEFSRLGADGYFVKESPENAGVKNFSKENFKAFKETVQNAYNKGLLLKKYWNDITYIKNNYLEEIIDKSNKKKSEYNTLFRSRINERLDMFFGLLKRGYEQNKFNEENFFFSDYELAFMTLWSILNEIQEAYYQKIHPNEYLTFTFETNEIKTHPNGKPINPINGYNWKIKNQEDYLIKHEFDLEFDKNGKIETNKDDYYKLKSKSFTSHLASIENEPFYEYSENSNNKNIWRELANQIAFLILKKNQLKDNEFKGDFLKSLKKLNKIRNHLYLTHGDNVGKGFYSKTEKDKRKEGNYNITPKKDIKQLFELVAFLLTGNNIN